MEFRQIVYLALCIAFTALSCAKTMNPTSGNTPCIKVSLTSPKGTDSQVLGFNVPITPIRYTVSNYPNNDSAALSGISVSAIGLPPGIKTSDSGNVFTLSGAASADSSSPYVYTILATGNLCDLPLRGVISVNNCGSIAPTSVSSPVYQSVAADSNISPITFNLGSGAKGATFTGLPSTLTGSFTDGVYTIAGNIGSASDTTYHYTVTTTGGYCSSSFSASISVTNCPVITLTSDSETVNQTVQHNGAIQPITYHFAGHYTGYAFFPDGALQASFNNGILTITGTATYPGPSFQYLLQVYTDDYSCGATTLEFYGHFTYQ